MGALETQLRSRTPDRRPRVRRTILVSLWCLAIGLTGCGLPEDHSRSRESVVLVTIDTLRADHLGLYGYPRATSPFLDRLGTASLVFENAISPCPHTAPAHASILTSLLPFQHGLLKNGQPLNPELETLAGLFSEAGYETAAFTSVSFLGELDSGFDHFEAAWRSGDVTVNRALRWLNARPEAAKERPFFLWVHLYDPHRLKGPREKLQPDVRTLEEWSKAEQDRFLDYLFRERGVDRDFYPDDRRLLDRYNLYDAAIRFADRQVGRLHGRIRASDPDALWIVTSDHGEGLGNHFYDIHGRYLYGEQLRVPLIVAGTGEPPRRIERLVRLVDIHPTLATWIGASPTAAGPDRIGAPLLWGEGAGDPGGRRARLAFAQRRPKDDARHRRRWEDGDLFSLQDLHYKYIHHTNGRDELYDLRRDPLELENRIDEASVAGDRMREWLQQYLDAVRRAEAEGRGGIDSEAATPHDEELRALGYL